ncbi:MAG: hypothetical protein JNK82_35735 [Myxococcaceae bacterium]|nr:hypothetical protein [Myxococcaceae bacterium]
MYLFDRAGRLDVLWTGGGSDHGFAGLGAYHRVCSVAVTADLDPAALLKNVDVKAVWEAQFDATRWGSGALERKEIADLLAREAEERAVPLAAFRADCKAQLVQFVRENLLPDDGPVAVRCGLSTVGYEVEVGGVKFWSMLDASPAGALELVQKSGKTLTVEQAGVLAALDATKPALAAAARAITRRRPGWLLEVLTWFRQETVVDGLKNHLPPTGFRHPDGRRWSIEAMQIQTWPEKARVTISIVDADGDRFDRSRDLPTFDEAKREREKLIAEVVAEGFVPA